MRRRQVALVARDLAERHIRGGLTEDAQKAAMAFLERRPPHFVGR